MELYPFEMDYDRLVYVLLTVLEEKNTHFLWAAGYYAQKLNYRQSCGDVGHLIYFFDHLSLL